MTCVVCKNGETHPGHATVSLQRGNTTVVFRKVPADVCENCHEHYLSENIASQLYKRADEAVKKGTEVEILRFAA